MDAYLEETPFGAILGPFDVDPIDKCHFSPFMTREKSASDKRHVIIDLSWPKHASVNAGVDKDSYLGTDFSLTFPTVDDITDQLKSLGKEALMYKVDISRAFRHIKIDPRDYDLLGLRWRDVMFIDTCLPFGSRHGTQIFTRVSDAVRHITRRKGYDITNYVDDFIGVVTPDVVRHSFDTLRRELRHLGLDISEKKLVPPSTVAVCLGVEIDSVHSTISIPAEKLTHICRMITEWSTKTSCSKRQLQSLLGNLLYVHKCVRPGRLFLNRMLDLLRANYDANHIKLTIDFRRDLRWFTKFLTKYNGTSYFDHRPTDGLVDLDACLVGLGGRYQSWVYHLPVVRHYRNLSIVHLGMINILVALRIFPPSWHRKQVLIRCDNEAVVQVLKSGRTRDPFLATCARNIWFESALADVSLIYTHIRGRDNKVADLLSRWQGAPSQFKALQELVENPVWVNTSSALLDLNYEI